MSNELKLVHCGCGGEAYSHLIGVPGIGEPDWYVECDNCGIRTSEYKIEEEAINAWNTAMNRCILILGDPNTPKSKTIG